MNEEKLAVLKCFKCNKQHNPSKNLNENFHLVVDKVLANGKINFKILCYECEVKGNE